MGDVKMLAMVGAVLGWPLMLLTLVLSSFTGGLFGAILLARHADPAPRRCRSARSSRLPRWPRHWWDNRSLDWYLGFYR